MTGVSVLLIGLIRSDLFAFYLFGWHGSLNLYAMLRLFASN
jgi:hypothetical protein